MSLLAVISDRMKAMDPMLDTPDQSLAALTERGCEPRERPRTWANLAPQRCHRAGHPCDELVAAPSQRQVER
jgi:hypothetical protein